MAIQVSVITCTYNPRYEYLTRVVDALRIQSLERNRWEYIVVDNASNTRLERELSLSWHPYARIVREDALGLTPARLRGIAESRGQVLVFLDDDNVPDADYLEQVLAVADEWPVIGAWGGQTIPEFERPPADWTRRYWGILAVRTFESDAWSNQSHVAQSMPSGAGLCVRRAVAHRYVELHATGRRGLALDRKGDSLVSGGDVDLASTACDMGFGVGVFVKLKITHILPAFRLSEPYLLRLVEGVAYSGVILDSYRHPPRPAARWSTHVANFLRLFLMGRRRRRFHRAFQRGEKRALAELNASNRSTFVETATPRVRI